MQVKFDERQLKQLNENIDELLKVTKAELPKVLRNAARDFVFQAIKETPLAGKVNVIPLYRYGNPVKNRQGKPIYIRVKSHFPRGRGFAKGSWVTALKGLGVMPKMPWHKKSTKEAYKFGRYVDGLKQIEPYFLGANQCPYIEELENEHPFMARTLDNTLAKMEKTLTKLNIKQTKGWGK